MNKPPYDRAQDELLAGIPGLMDMSINDGLKAIDEFVANGWVSPALSFNPWSWFGIAKHNQQYPIVVKEKTGGE